LKLSVKPAELLDLALKARMDKTVETWFADKSERLGFALVRDNSKGRLKFQAEGYQWHALPRKGKVAGFSSVDFEGEMEVTNGEYLPRRSLTVSARPMASAAA
jgi:CRISPR system Cascade subunit CasE